MRSMQYAVTRLAIILCSCFLVSMAAASTINVPAQQPTIQAGINAAVNGDTVLVAAGTYNERIDFTGKNIKVVSASGPAVTIIDAGGFGNAVTIDSNETSAALIRGFTMRNANQSAIYVWNASPTIQNNIILQGYSYWGCGIYLGNAGAIVEGNLVTALPGSSCYQGTIYVSGNSPAQIIGNIIAQNPSDGIYIDGLSSALTVVSNTIIDNQGRGINENSIYTGGQLSLVQNVIANNQGTGVFWSNPPVLMVSNTVTSNLSAPYGFWMPEGSEVYGQTVNNQVTMENNLLVASGFSPAFSCDNYDYSNLGIIDHNDVYAANALPYGSNCPDLTATAGNISADPLFIALLSNNLHLSSTSPAIKHGNNSVPQLPTHDMDGDARIINTIVDIGADEYSGKMTLKLSAYDLQFGSQKVGTTSPGKTVTLSNNGTAAISIAMIATAGEFSQTNNCSASLAPATKCQIVVKFSPAGGGLRSSVLAIMTGATLNPIAAELSGNGLTPNVSFNPSDLFYGWQMFGTSNTQTSTLTNTGFAPLSITGFAISGSADFTQTNNCPLAPATLAVGGSCAITVTWVPAIAYGDSGTLTVTDNAVPNTQNLSLLGLGYSAGVATLTPGSLSFPTTLLGSTSAAQTVTLSNTGTGALGNISINSDYQYPQTNNCPVTLAVGASCTISVSFAPVNVGTQNGSIWINDDAYNGTTLPVTGQGQAPLPTLASLSPSSIAAGSADTSLVITGTGFVPGSQVLYNGVPLWTYNYGNSQLIATVSAPSLAQAGTASITVYNPSPGGGTSNPLTLTIYTPLNYAEQSVTYAYKSITGTNLKLCPWCTAQITSPFAIQFGGGNFNTLTVAGAGTISFSSFGDYNNVPIPDNQVSTLIAPFWTALYPFGAGTNNNVFWQVTGTAPNRQLVIEWRNVEYWYAAGSTQTVKFEVVFYEGSGQIRFNYADTVFGGSAAAADNGATATVGVQVSPNLGYQFSYNTASLASGTSQLWYPNAPTATVSTNALNFGWDQIGTPTAAQKVTLTNGSPVPLHISGITTNNSDFTTTDTCGTSLAAGASCSIFVTFDPSSPVAESATLTINDDALGGPQTVTLNGIGAIQTTVVFPINLRFGMQNVGTSATLPVTLANAATTTMTIQSITPAPSVYTQTNNCGTSLAPGTSCTINVTFTPTAVGLVNGTLSMALNGNPSQVMVNLSGQGQ